MARHGVFGCSVSACCHKACACAISGLVLEQGISLAIPWLQPLPVLLPALACRAVARLLQRASLARLRRAAASDQLCGGGLHLGDDGVRDHWLTRSSGLPERPAAAAPGGVLWRGGWSACASAKSTGWRELKEVRDSRLRQWLATGEWRAGWPEGSFAGYISSRARAAQKIIVRRAISANSARAICSVVAQTGHESYEWPLVVVKELVDNSIDACEEAGVAPVITVAIWSDEAGKRIVIEDNGPGIRWVPA
jgi:hypothetical protein